MAYPKGGEVNLLDGSSRLFLTRSASQLNDELRKEQPLHLELNKMEHNAMKNLRNKFFSPLALTSLYLGRQTTFDTEA